MPFQMQLAEITKAGFEIVPCDDQGCLLLLRAPEASVWYPQTVRHAEITYQLLGPDPDDHRDDAPYRYRLWRPPVIFEIAGLRVEICERGITVEIGCFESAGTSRARMPTFAVLLRKPRERSTWLHIGRLNRGYVGMVWCNLWLDVEVCFHHTERAVPVVTA